MKKKTYLVQLYDSRGFTLVKTITIEGDGILAATVEANQIIKDPNLYVAAIEEQK